MGTLVKRFFLVSIFSFFMFSVSFAETTEAVLYYGNGCPHCSKVSKYIEEKNLDISLTKKEI